MKINKVIIFFCIINIGFLTGCQQAWNMPIGATQRADENKIRFKENGYFEITDHDLSTMENGAVEIDLDLLTEGEQDGYSYDGRSLYIFVPGYYTLRGELNRGGIVVNVYEDEVVHLILDNVRIKSDGTAIFVEKAEKVVLTAAPETENVISDGSEKEGEQQACIFSNTDLTINGTGTWTIYGYYGDAIRCKDQLKVINTDLYAKTKGDGLRGNDGVIVQDCVTELECEGVGIRADSSKDRVIIRGGSCKIISGKNAISAKQYVSVSECLVDFYSVLEEINCAGKCELEVD